MRVCVLSSGSKGNCVYVETKNHKILVDIGTSSLYAEKALKANDINPNDIDMVFITHAHVDHIAGVNVFSKKYHPNIYLTEKMEKEADLHITNQVYIEKEFLIDTLKVIVIKTSHDVTDANGYIFEEDGESFVYITDTGYVNEKYYKVLSNRNMYVFESNHDIEKLMNNKKYPHYTKIRILSDRGHLSNEEASNYLAAFIGDKTEYVVLSHLSEENNTPELAVQVLKNTLEHKKISFNNISVAHQNEATEMFSL